MSTIVNLPNGSAVLKDEAEMSNREVKDIRKSARKAFAMISKLKDAGFDENDSSTWGALSNLTEGEDEYMDYFQRFCVVARLTSWTLDLPLPKTPEEVDDLPRPIFVPLTVAAANIKFSDEFTLEGAADPKVDIESSNN